MTICCQKCHCKNSLPELVQVSSWKLIITTLPLAERNRLCISLLMGCWHRSFAWRWCSSQQRKLESGPSASLLQVLRLRAELPCCPSAGCPAWCKCRHSAEDSGTSITMPAEPTIPLGGQLHRQPLFCTLAAGLWA